MRCLRIARGSFSFPTRLDLEREIGSLDSSGWFLSGLKTDGQPGGGMLCTRAFAPGLRSTRLPLESEPLLRPVSYMKAQRLCSSAPLPRVRDQRDRKKKEEEFDCT